MQFNMDVELPTEGKVTLHTSKGPVDVVLWSKETPKACRNFIQLCLDGYYDGCKFHRIIKNFMVQTGDPTGTGEGGKSIYDENFDIELHNRLRFKGRGMLAMAGSKLDPEDPDSGNGSQFFITLTEASWLDKKHTIFARIEGKGIYNILEMNDLEVDGDDVPVRPPTILRAEVQYNPFPDLVPRNKRAAGEEAPAGDEFGEPPKKKKKRGATRKSELISFGDEEEPEMEFGKGMKSSHDVLTDKRLLKETAYEGIEGQGAKPSSEKSKEEAAPAGKRRSGIVTAESKKRAAPKDDFDDTASVRSEGTSAGDILRQSRILAQAKEFELLRKRMIREAREAKGKKEGKVVGKKMSALDVRRQAYLKNKGKKREKGLQKEKLSVFKNMLTMSELEDEKEEDEEGHGGEEEDDDAPPPDRVAGSSKYASKMSSWGDEDPAPKPAKADEDAVEDPMLKMENPELVMEAMFEADDDISFSKIRKHNMVCPKGGKSEMDDYYVVEDPLDHSAGGKGAREQRDLDRLKSIRTADNQNSQIDKKRKSESLRLKAKGSDIHLDRETRRAAEAASRPK